MAHNISRRMTPASIVVLLVLAVSVLMIPTLGVHLDLAVRHHEVALSDVAAVVLLIVFVLSTPGSVRREPRPSPEDLTAEDKPGTDGPPAASVTSEQSGEAGATVGGWSIQLVVALLLASSVAAAFVSDWFVAALSPALSALHMSEAFAGLVVVAIAGNAVENVVGVQLAARNRSDYAALGDPAEPGTDRSRAHPGPGAPLWGHRRRPAHFGAVTLARRRSRAHDFDRGCRRAGRGVDLARGSLPGGSLRRHRHLVLVGMRDVACPCASSGLGANAASWQDPWDPAGRVGLRSGQKSGASCWIPASPAKFSLRVGDN